jgi:hypothetical protein
MIDDIKTPKRYSCWNKATAIPNNKVDFTNMKQKPGDIWGDSMEIANSIISNTFTPSGKWNHYYNPHKCDPDWSYDDGQKRPYDAVGNHYFMLF